METSFELAAGSGGALWLILVGVLIAAALIGALVYGSRRTRERARRDTQVDPPAEESGPAQRGRSWQTINDDPDHGNPHP
ncbi:DUF6479 family protein [Streptomyces sp. NPDC001941]|uniref:DUF6479 family protein n=1 Tax=Streptomyces sp. NPDC001941 TaxID=3154659 RepID=UPI0033216A3B